MNTSPNEITIRMMFNVYESVIDGDEAYYCSAPVTSGKRYIDWLDRIGKDFTDVDAAHEDHRQSHFDEVIEENRVHARHVVKRLRKELREVVIDPTVLPHIDGWTQPDWRLFWQRVIERYVSTAVFVNDWHYSNGCVFEFWVAHNKGIPTLDENQRPLSLAAGIDMISGAIRDMRQRRASTAFIEKVLSDLKSLEALQGAAAYGTE